MFAAKKLQGAGGAAAAAPLIPDPDFNSVSFLSHFDGANNGVNNVFDDGSASNHTITANGNVTQGSFGPFARPAGEWGVAFDGNGDYLTTTNTNIGNFGTANFTVEFWVYSRGSLAAFGMPISAYNANNSANHWSIQFDRDSAGNIYWYNQINLGINSSIKLVNNQWTHLAVVRNGGTTTMYVNGLSGGSFSDSTNYVTPSGLTIGSDLANPTLWELNGYLSNLRIVKGGAVYTSAFTPPTTPLTAITNTTLLTCQSNRLVDNSVSALPLTIVGNPAVSAISPFAPTEAYDPAVNGASAFFNSQGNFLVAPNTTDLQFGTGDFTVEFFWYSTDLTGYQTPYNHGKVASGAFLLQTDPNGVITGYLSGYLFIETTNDTSKNQWHHIAVTRSGTTVRCFRNGVQTASATSSANLNYSGQTDIGAAATDTTQRIIGYMSDVRVVKGTAVYTSAFTPPTAPLTAITDTKLLLNMADGQAIDSAAKNDLTLFGNAKISSTQSKFGGTSLVLGGTVNDFALSNNLDDLSGPFTIECWAWTNSTSNSYIFCVGSYKPELGINGNDLRMYISGGGYINFFTGGEFTINTWHHIALVRDSSNVIKCYLNGTASATTYTVAGTLASLGQLFIGGEKNGAAAISHPWNGYIDDLRISNGVARYTSNFTPPSAAFPDIGE
jgi:hypothetical protein